MAGIEAKLGLVMYFFLLKLLVVRFMVCLLPTVSLYQGLSCLLWLDNVTDR